MDTSKHLIPQTATLGQALASLNALSGQAMTIFVTDGDGILTGSLTDGDVRRALLAGASLGNPVTTAMHRKFGHITDSDAPLDTVNRLRNMRNRGIRLVPRLDAQGHLLDIMDLRLTPTLLPMQAILMAGGKGERLRPMTLTTPKPLLEIEGKAIIDYNIEALAACGIKDITVITRYLAEKIHEHFSRPVAGVNVRCVTEEAPLGTIGGARLADGLDSDGNTLVMNSDLLTTISYEDMFLRHSAEDADVTVAVIPYQVSVPFAILTTDGPRVTGIAEKPSYSYYANAGIYIFRNELLAKLPTDTRTDATDLIEQVIARGGRVVYHPVNGTWIDVGSPTDFRQATELMRHHRNLSANQTQL